jgi:hypothetical protein
MYLFEDWNCVCLWFRTYTGRYHQFGLLWEEWNCVCGSEPTQAGTISLVFYMEEWYSILGFWFRSHQGRFQLCEHEQHIRYAAPDLQTDINLSQKIKARRLQRDVVYLG